MSSNPEIAAVDVTPPRPSHLHGEKVLIEQIIACLRSRNLLHPDGERHISIQRTDQEEFHLSSPIDAFCRKVQFDKPCRCLGVSVCVESAVVHLKFSSVTAMIRCLEDFRHS